MVCVLDLLLTHMFDHTIYIFIYVQLNHTGHHATPASYSSVRQTTYSNSNTYLVVSAENPIYLDCSFVLDLVLHYHNYYVLFLLFCLIREYDGIHETYILSFMQQFAHSTTRLTALFVVVVNCSFLIHFCHHRCVVCVAIQ